jgi:transcriptional regulator with PAS, ATPase and Fis domain
VRVALSVSAPEELNASKSLNEDGGDAVTLPVPTPERLRSIFSTLGFVTASSGMLPVLQHAYKAALVSDTTVLLQGETGTGKQVLARAVHLLDEKRREFGFVTVHCGTVNEGLAESELFGHCKGSFSGADKARAGLFQAADRGTVFLDDVNDLSLRLQPKLLDALQRGIIRPIGSDREARVDVRIIAAANEPLEPMVEAGTFRADLYHRLNVIQLRLPPLRERVEDLEALTLEFTRRHANLHRGIDSLEPDLLEYLQGCSFEGNVRELENAVQRALFLKESGTMLTLADWIKQGKESGNTQSHGDEVHSAARMLWAVLERKDASFPDVMKRIEGELLRRALISGRRTRREIAGMLHTSERTLYHKINAHRIGPASRRAE